MGAKLNQKGFSAIEAVLIALVVAIIGGTGFYVYNANKKSDQALDEAHKSSQATTSKPAKKSQPKVEPKPVYSDNDITLYNLAELASSEDQKSIVKAVVAQCETYINTAESTLVSVGIKSTFKEVNIFKIDGKFARLSTGCYTLPIEQSDGGARYVLKKTSNNWVVMFAGQMSPNCTQVDGTGIPTTIIGTCYDESTGDSRAPKS